jgi:hypothetical protein
MFINSRKWDLVAFLVNIPTLYSTSGIVTRYMILTPAQTQRTKPKCMKGRLRWLGTMHIIGPAATRSVQHRQGILRIVLKGLEFLDFNSTYDAVCQWLFRLHYRRTILRLGLLLSSCQSGGKIEINYNNGVPIFKVSREDSNVVCVTAINVLEGTGELGSKTHWVLRQNYEDIKPGRAKCHNVFVYGKSMNGYEQEFDGKILIPGKIIRSELTVWAGLLQA